MRKLIYASVLLMSACAQIPFATRSALQDLDFMTTDVAAMRFSVVHAVNIPLASAAIFTITMGTPEGVMSESFELVNLAEPLFNDTQVRDIFAISDGDRARFDALQRNMRALKEKYPDESNGSVSVSATGCLTGDAPDGPMLVSVAIGLEDEAGWLTLLRNVDLRTLAVEGAAIQRCGT
ncbi:MAG: hypothetical protein JKY31_11055 [Rhodobacteraceae bacterium]|nr:hypothetical protein [Paracoccaceae bacterium]